jgi:hypothetical protein
MANSIFQTALLPSGLPAKLYHYTSEKAKQIIVKSGILKGSVSGAYGEGVYATAVI